MQNKPVALVTGANKGIGRQTAKDLAAHPSPCSSGRATSSMGDGREEWMTALALQLDVTNKGSIAATAERIRNKFGFTSTSRQGVSHEGMGRLRENESRHSFCQKTKDPGP